MSGLFGGNAKESQAAQQAYANKQSKKIGRDIRRGTDQSVGMLMDENEKLALHKLSPFYANMPGYGFETGMDGDKAFGKVTRSGETQGFMDRLLAGLGADESSYQELLSQIRPGFGRLSEATQEQIRNQYAKRFGDLREQLGRRRVLGSSFSNAELDRMKLEEDQQTRLAMSQAMIEELKMTSDVLKSQTDSRNQTIQTAFSQLQFEGNLGINLTNMVMASMNENLQAQQDLIKLAAGVKMQGTLGAANIQGQLANTVTGSFPGYAEMQNAEDAAFPQFVATLGGAALGNTKLMSDPRVKENIEMVGELFDGTPVYRFRYIGWPVMQIGLMANEVTPEAVSVVNGYKMVDYEIATNNSVRGR
jgi:hypothetical protein